MWRNNVGSMGTGNSLYRAALVSALSIVTWSGAAVGSTASKGAVQPVINTSDVSLFYKIYDAAEGHPTAEQLQTDYIEAGSEGLQVFSRLRNITGARIAGTIDKKPGIYADARRCAKVLPQVRSRLAGALERLAAVYPEARFPPVTIAVGRGRPVGVGGPEDGVQIGLEALCATDFLNADVEDRFVYVITHEFVHVQQAQEFVDQEAPTVLEVSLQEGAAEFVTELIAGGVAYSHLQSATAGRELEIETAFAVDKDKTDLSDWVYNATKDNPGDLGYWVGYRIVKSYYRNAGDKDKALREILEMTDAQAFLDNSGWSPGVSLR